MRLPFRLSIRRGLHMVFAVVTVAAALAFVVSQLAINRVQEEVIGIAGQAMQLQKKVEQLRHSVIETQRLSMQGVMLEDQSRLFMASGESIRFYELVDEIILLLNSDFTGKSPHLAQVEFIEELTGRLEVLRDRYEIYLQAVMSLSADLVENMQHESGDVQMISDLQREFNTELDDLHRSISGLVQRQINATEDAYMVSHMAAYAGIVVMILVITLAMVFVRRYLTGPVSKLLQFVRHYEQDQSYEQRRIDYDRQDEIGDLCRAINHMLDNIERLTVSRNQLEHAHDRLQNASQAKSAFLSSMSHELRTPLTAVIGYAQLLESEKDSINDDEYALFLGNIVTSGQHLLMLVEDVLDLEKIEAGHMKINLEKISLEYVINETLALLATQAEIAGITLINSVPVHEENFVLADPGRLRQVLINLISNGIKYNRPGGKVIVDCQLLADDHWLIEVIDSGTGMSDEDLGSLFQPFERLRYKNSNVPGTGIGLVISRQLMHMMDGDIIVESRLGEGSRFAVRIPALTTKQGD